MSCRASVSEQTWGILMKAAVYAASVALALSGAPALAQTSVVIPADAPRATPAATSVAPQAAEEVECRTIRATGSRVGRGRRVCLTPSQWANQARRHRESTEQLTRDNHGMRPERGG